MDAAAPSEVYLHIRVIIGIVLALSIARLLNGLARLVQHPRHGRVYLVHLGWVATLLLDVLHFWWWEFRLAFVQTWTFGIYFFVIFYASLFFFLCALLFPEDLEDYADFEDYFISRRKWFFGILAVTFVADLFDTLLKGVAYFESLGPEYPVRAAVYVALCLVAMAVTDRRFHAWFVAVSLVYQVTWILRLYRILL